MGIKIYYNDKTKEAYGLHNNIFYRHIDKTEWLEVSAAKTPFRILNRHVFDALYEAFEIFLGID